MAIATGISSVSALMKQSFSSKSNAKQTALTPEQREQARLASIEQCRTLLRNLQSRGLIDRAAVRNFERDVARDERRRRHERLKRTEADQYNLPRYTPTALPSERSLASTDAVPQRSGTASS